MKRHPRGFALVVTLIILVLVTILVVGLLVSTRLDRTASSSNLDRLRAEVAANQGVENVKASLRGNIYDPTQVWINQPGRLFNLATASQSTTTTPLDDKKVPLHEILLTSGVPTAAAPGVLAPAKLNVPLYDSTAGNYILSNGDGSGTHSSMLLKWVYVRADGTLDTAESPTLTNDANPIVSRYAYWTDDESTKLNLNLAWKRNQASTPLNHPRRSSLSALSLPSSGQIMDATLVDAIYQYPASTPGLSYNSLMAVKMAGTNVAPTIEANKFNATHYGVAPSATTFYTLASNRAIYINPIFLTTNLGLAPNSTNPTSPDSMAGLRKAGMVPVYQTATAAAANAVPNFIDIIDPARTTDPATTDPAYLPYLSANKLNKVIVAIRTQLLRTDWPVAPGKDLITKWYGSNLSAVERVQAADQVAMNIIDFVRIKESKLNLVLPIMAVPTTASATTTSPVYTFKSFRLNTDTSSTASGSSEYLYACNASSDTAGLTNVTNAKWIMGGRAPVITEMTMVIDESPRSNFSSGSSSYWPKKVPQEIDTTTHRLSGSTTNGTGGDTMMYRCKVYVELYLPNYPGLPSDFAIKLNETGSAAWPEALPPSDVASHNGQSGTTMESSAKWCLGLPDETSSIPDLLKLDSSKGANYSGASTDGRNHVTYYVTSQTVGTITPSTYGKPYVNADGVPLGRVNYAVPYVLPSEFIGGSSKGILKPGQRIVIAKEFWRTATKAQRPTANMRVGLSFGPYIGDPVKRGLACSGNGEAPFAVAMAPFWGPINVPLQSISSAAYDSDDLTGIRSLQVDDPKLGYYPLELTSTQPQQWQWLPHTFNDVNANSEVGKDPSLVSSQQDLDGQRKVSDHGVWWLPAPTAIDGTNNRVVSLGELGSIHTGMAKKPEAMVPWRTLRLQPDSSDPAVTTASYGLPDWVLLDAFAVPPLVNTAGEKHPELLVPNGTSQGGRVNLNTSIYPTSLTTERRTGGVLGVLVGAKKNATDTLSPTEALSMAKNIAEHILADGQYVGKAVGNPDLFDSVGEVTEIKGIADRGEASEETVRDLLALASVRSNLFTVYSVGQALKQTPDHKLVVTAEKRQQEIVERSVRLTTTPDPAAPTVPAATKVSFHTVYSRDLHP